MDEKKIQSPPSVFSPLYAAPLSFFLRTSDFIIISWTTTWLFPKNCILGTSTEHKCSAASNLNVTRNWTFAVGARSKNDGFGPLEYIRIIYCFRKLGSFPSWTTTWLFPKNCILGTSTEHKMWPEIEHLRWVHVPKTMVSALWNTLELSIVSEN